MGGLFLWLLSGTSVAIGGNAVFSVGLVGVHIRCCGNGCLGFRPYPAKSLAGVTNQTCWAGPVGARSHIFFVSYPDTVNARHPVGASLLAKAACQFAVMLDVPGSSRAGSLPQYFVSYPDTVNARKLCGSGLAREGGGSAIQMLLLVPRFCSAFDLIWMPR